MENKEIKELMQEVDNLLNSSIMKNTDKKENISDYFDLDYYDEVDDEDYHDYMSNEPPYPYSNNDLDYRDDDYDDSYDEEDNL